MAMASLQLVLFFALCSIFSDTWAKNTSEGLKINEGEIIPITAAPYMAALYSNGKFVCSGSIVHEQFILTSVDCCAKSKYPKFVVIGANDPNIEGKVIDVMKEITHKPICLVKLKEKIKFESKNRQSKIDRISLFGCDVLTRTSLQVDVTGWQPFSKPFNLRKATINTQTRNYCLAYFRRLGINEFCAGLQGKDGCVNYNGGPVIFPDLNVLVGVMPLTSECRTPFRVYTKIAPYVKWIKKELKK